jgi:tetratricopeptide (TPR) repeat protein
MDTIDLYFGLNKVITRILRVIVFIIIIFLISVNYECGAGKRYKIVILPFKDNTRLKRGETISDVLRSTVTQTGYFTAVDRDKIYEAVIDVVPSDLIKIDNTKRVDGAFTADQIDLIARLDTKRVQKFSKKLKADYAVRGTASQFADSLRIDAEIINVNNNKSLGFVSVEGTPEDLLIKMIKELSGEITMFCRSLNAYDDALGIMGMYNQGQYTFNVSEKKLKEILSIHKDAVGIRASLMVLYLSKIRKEGDFSLEDKVIEEGEKILMYLDQDFDEKILEVFLTSGFNPFDEIAKIYSKRGANDKAIEIYQAAIRDYPINIAGHYKGLGMLYLKKGLEDEAIQAFLKSLDVNKCSYELHFILASIFETRDQPDKASEHFEECIKYARNVEEIKTAKEKINELAIFSH